MSAQGRSSDIWYDRWPGYVLAIGAVTIATAVRAVLEPTLGQRSAYLLFCPAILVTAGIGGSGPGITAIAVSTAAASLFAENLNSQASLIETLLFVGTAAGIVLFAAQISVWRQHASDSRSAALASHDRAIQLSRELELLIDGALNYAIYMLDPSGRVAIWNLGAERILGWSEGEILGRHSSIFYQHDEIVAGKPEGDLTRALAEGRVEEEGWRLRKDGGGFLASVTITALFNGDGHHVGFGKVVRDVTEARASEALIEASEMQLRSILATMPEAMVVIDRKGAITSFSVAAEQLFGYSQVDVIGRNVRMLMPEPYRSDHDGYVARYRETGERRALGMRRRVMGLRRDGTTFPLELSIGESFGGGQQVFTGFIRDLSLQEETEARLQSLQSELVHVSRVSAMGTMASTLAHELNQPLTAVTSYVEASRDLFQTNRAEDRALLGETLDQAVGQALRAGSIVRRLREFVARGDTDKAVEDVPALVTEAAALGFAGAAESGVRHECIWPDGLGPVLADRIQIQQVLINLMRNAVEALVPRGGGTVTIRASQSAENIHIIVADDGPGLDPKIASRLFGAFHTTKRTGMGLGLSICRTIV
ncbi:MAG TPA: PAS domain S-box protein, partial [Acetobacteraceae bacterium]|nr:PAS domain S-box protein [Acetobacteraceae bacterium]